MAIHKIHDNYLVYKSRKIAEVKYRKDLSAQLIDKFGRGPYEQKVITDIITFCLTYYISKFEAICISRRVFPANVSRQRTLRFPHK